MMDLLRTSACRLTGIMPDILYLQLELKLECLQQHQLGMPTDANSRLTRNEGFTTMCR